MIRQTIRGMAARKARTALTAIAIVLGVAMVSGAFTLTDTMRSAADSLSTASYAGTDAAVSAKTAFDTGIDDFELQTSVPERTLEQVRADDRVQTAVGDITDEAKLLDRDGQVQGDGPYFGVGFDAGTPDARQLTPFRIVEGAFAARAGQVVIDQGTAEKLDLGVGDDIEIATRGPKRAFEITGIATFGDVKSLGTATFAVFDLDAAQGLFDKRGRYDSVLASARPGVDGAELRESLRSELPGSVQVRTAAAQDRFTLDGLKFFISIIRGVLLAFGAVALLVGGFTIVNTLSITVAQRTRELAMLRSIGASRRQVLGAVTAEALLLGVGASVVGVAAGVGLAAALSGIFSSLGLELPQAGLVFALRTVIVAMVMGIVITLLAGLIPAGRATRISPVAALREGAELPPGRIGRHSGKIGLVLAALALVSLVGGAASAGLGVGDRMLLMAPGVLLSFIAVAVLSPSVVPSLVRVVGQPSRRINRTIGLLATRNAARHPGRTAGAASALMIGIALVSCFAVIGNGLRESISSSISDELRADVVVAATDGFSPIDTSVAREAGDAPGARVATGWRQSAARTGGKTINVDAVDPGPFSRVVDPSWEDGSVADLRTLATGEAIVTKRFAEDRSLAVGDDLILTSPTKGDVTLRVRALSDPPPFNSLAAGEVTVNDRTFDRSWEASRDRFAYVLGSTPAQVREALASHPEVDVRSQEAFIDDQAAGIDPILGIVYVLLALAVIISLFGIINTLALSVLERTREVGMLRAIGATRRQIRRSVRHESVITTLIGAVLGIAVGLTLAALATVVLSGEGLVFAIPVGALVAFVVIAVVAGVLAAVVPARRASRLDILEALHYE
ncbi:MAG: ABC transporter permease [Solirubrobacterales bacterium]